MAFIRFLILSLTLSATLMLSPASAQTTTAPCTPSMITTFTPCMNFATNSSLNGTTPSSDCCNSLKSLMSSSKDCLCLIATGSIPFQIPINRTLAISLPRACNMPGVPLQCKAAAAPVPAPAQAPGPSLSPDAAPSPSVKELAPPQPEAPSSGTGADATPTPPASTTGGGAPASNTGSRAGMTPSGAQSSYSISVLHLMAVVGGVALMWFY